MGYECSCGQVLLAAACLVASGVAAAAAGEAQCSQLTTRESRWPDPTTTIESASWRAAGYELKSPMGAVALPAHCKVTAVMRERVGADGQRYAIRFRLRLPEAWNQRFFFQGGGGTNGDIGDAAGNVAPGTPTALARGYAVASQDSGHDNARNSVPERGGAVAFGFDPQARADYGGTSLKPVADASKTLIATFYGTKPVRSYFVGCSKGGQEGMAFAQRYPDEFDGIVAGSPGFSLPRAAVAEAWDTQAFASLIGPGKTAASVDATRLPATFSNAQFGRVREAVLAACDADDGVKDGITANWSALAAIFTTPPTAVRAVGPDAFDYALKFDFDRDPSRLYAKDAAFPRSAWEDVSARSADMSAFRKHGAKMIVPHGVSDPVFSINDTVQWYREVDRLNGGKAASFVRVFPVPGMAHCAGGPATDQFVAFDALVDRVEKGMAPEKLVAKAGAASPWPGRTRPLCPYPKMARYIGTGNVENADSFRCE